MTRDFQRLADTVAQTRQAKGWTTGELARETGLSEVTIHRLERADSEPVRHQFTRDQVELVFGWRRGSITTILEGGDPTADGLGAL